MKSRLQYLLILLLCLLSYANCGAELKYIFYFIGDGMGMGQIMAAESYNRTVLGNKDHLLMMQFPTAAMITTYSTSSPVTDSAAAGTALATGSKTRNSMLGMNADSIPVTSIAKTLFDKGFGVGLVTSVAPDDATPGAFYAHVPNRRDYYQVGCQMAESGYDFIAGAGLRGITDKKTGQPTDLLDRFASNEVAVVRGLDTLSHINSSKILLLNTDTVNTWNIGYTIDSIPGALTLPALTEACLRHLDKNGRDRFFMMVEGGNIDHAAHANDAGATIKEIIAFQEAIRIAYDFYLAHPDETLIVVTADHETGGLGLGNTVSRYKQHLEYIDAQKISKENFSDFCQSILRSRRVFTWEEMKEALTDNFGLWKTIPVNEKQSEALRADFEKCFIEHRGADQKTLYNDFNEFAVNVCNIMDTAIGVGWTTTGHTGGLVPLFAIGVGAEKFAGFADNTDIPRTIMEIADMNP